MRRVLVAVLISSLVASYSRAEDHPTFEGDMVFVPPTHEVEITGDDEVGIGRFEREQQPRFLSDIKMPVAKEFKGADGGKAPKQIVAKFNKKGQLVGLTDGESDLTISKKSKGGKRSANW